MNIPFIFPPLHLILFLSPFLILYNLFNVFFMGWLNEKGIPSTYTIKIFHILTFTLAGFLQVKFHLPGVILLGLITAFTILYTLIQGKPLSFYRALSRRSDDSDQALSIFFRLISTALGGSISYFLTGHFFLVGLLICGWGDAAAQLIGRSFGRHPYRIPLLFNQGSIRSIEGSLAMFAVGTFASFIALSFLPVELSWQHRSLVSLTAAAAGTVAEALSSSKTDNLTIQVSSSLTAYLISHAIYIS